MKRLFIPIFSIVMLVSCGTAKTPADAATDQSSNVKGDKAFLTAYK
jgi:hypothetical protein